MIHDTDTGLKPGTCVAIEGDAHFRRLGWRRLTVVLIVESIALGALSLPRVFADLGMVLGVVLCVTIGLICMYGSFIIGQVKLKYPHVSHYADIGGLMFAKPGYALIATFITCHFILVSGSHCLTGTIALANITQSSICSLAFSVISAVVLLLLALPPSFADLAILGYIDFVSVLVAIGVTIVATGIRSSEPSTSPAHTAWSAWPREGLTFAEAFISVNNIVFAYAFTVVQPSFMAEMHTPEDYVKATWALTIMEIIIYIITGGTIYAFVGQDVEAPALLSAGPLISRVAFGLALPVIFISGSINITVISRFIHGSLYRDSIVRYINTGKGWLTWIATVSIITVISWAIAEAIPFFTELLSITSSLFMSGFSFYFPGFMWFLLLKSGKWYSRHNIFGSFCAGSLCVIGFMILVAGVYASISELVHKFQFNLIGRPYSCSLSS
ncbi:transmembrane amino acid transporter protein-domain-containing protein [Aspergillus avenaceus]|uniref:Transmembrane amino acid transporter protein-domain-containing protein n=1 Tax=Aspergillus avenaceus TaxID=36643 RepID=A0A5N6TW81_ASPAV|nr:transmembrane amino acid transporter protein-domain-containing protein [Aspergillus avenaceus]